ncbi:hypothetical protein [Streptomyces platensis]|uniref:hypothetical protein n=1 Tax=Streptomyces platensis TaxID=58346 RepID=UPI003865FEFD|nr:hypothetical protein OG962_03850 [Streptomyces platensis]
MSNINGTRVSEDKLHAVQKQKELGSDTPATGPVRLTIGHALLITVFPVLGCILYLVGHVQLTEVLELLAGCGGIGAGVTVIVTGGRRMASASASAISRMILAAANKRG